MSTAQDIYDALINNPDYQEANGLTREEVVEREAKRRARQHHNNELALSMAVQNSAIDKLVHFLSKAEEDDDDDDESKLYMDTDEGAALGDYISSGLNLLKPDRYFSNRLVSNYIDPFGQRWPSGIDALFDALNNYVHEPKVDVPSPAKREETGAIGPQRVFPGEGKIKDTNRGRWDASLDEFINENRGIDPSKIFHHLMASLVDKELGRAMDEQSEAPEGLPAGFTDAWKEHAAILSDQEPKVELDKNIITPIESKMGDVTAAENLVAEGEQQERQARQDEAKAGAERSRGTGPVGIDFETYSMILESAIKMRKLIHPDILKINFTDEHKQNADDAAQAENDRLTGFAADLNPIIERMQKLAGADRDKQGIIIPKAEADFIKTNFTTFARRPNGTIRGGNLTGALNDAVAEHRRTMASLLGQTPDPQGETVTPVELSALNADHMTAHRTKWDKGSPWKMWNPLDWKIEDEEEGDDPGERVSTPWGDLLPGWDATFFSEEARRELREARFISAVGINWKWTTKGLEQFKPIVDALHKPWPFGETVAPSMQNRGMVRTSIVLRILDSIIPKDEAGNSWAANHKREESTETISPFTLLQVNDEHRELKDNRDTQNATGITESENDLPGREVISPLLSDEEDSEVSRHTHKVWWDTGLPHERDGYFDTDKDKDTGEVKGYQHPKVLLPSDNDGESFNPLEKFDADGVPVTTAEAQKMYATLKDIFKKVSSSLVTDFPSSYPDKVDRPFYYDYNKDEFTDDQKARFNKLNTNKAILEPWLYRFQEYLDPSVHGKSDRWGTLWEGEPEWPARPGTYHWHELLSSMAPQGLQIKPDVEEGEEFRGGSAIGGGVGKGVPKGMGALDHEGNLNFFAIPHSFSTFTGNSYNPTVDLLQSFRGNFDLPDTDKVAEDWLTQQYGKDWVDKNFRKAYEDYVKTAVPKKVRGTSQSIEAAQLEKRENIGGLYEWLAAKTDDDVPRYSTYKGETSEDIPIGSGGTGPGGSTNPSPVDEDVIDDDTDFGQDPFDEQGELTDPDLQEDIPSDDPPPDDPPPDDPPPGDPPSDGEQVPSGDPSSDGEQVPSGEPLIIPPDEAARKEELIDKIFRHEDKLPWADREHKTDFRKILENSDLEQLQSRWEKVQNELATDRRKASATGVKAEEAKAKEPSTLGDKRRQELINEYINTYRERHKQALDPRLVKVLENKSDKDLQQEHEKLLQEFGAYKREESTNLKGIHANNIDFGIKPLAPLQEHLTKEDILMQARRLIHHNVVYGKFMDSDSKKVWKERMAEAHQLAEAANMNLDLRLQEDMEEANEKGDFGSTNWLERVGDTHVETQTRRNAHRDVVSRGSELRTNANYKPHIIATYNDDGTFQGFNDLKTGQGVDQFNLRFNEDDHYHFHGLDPEKVKDFQKYLALKRQAGKSPQPGDIPPVFGPPPAPTNPELAELEKKINGVDYKDIRDRFSTIGDLPGAQQIFNNKFTKDAYGRFGNPVNPDGSGMEAPRFHQGVSDKIGRRGWYHPESESWINPYRYQELIDHMGGQPNSGRVILNGGQFYGKGIKRESNPADPKYAFAIPTEAKKQQFRSGYGDQSYYIDDTGAIAHAHDSFEAGNMQSHDQPQNVNGVIHDWYAQQIGNQMKANPSAFADEQGRLRQVAVTDTQPVSPNQPPPIQNMWLELAAGESLGREPGSALARRDKKKQSGWEWFDSKLSKPKAVASRVRHPLSRVARTPLSSQELGQEQWWSRRKEAKQKYYDVLDKAPVPIVSWAGHFLLGLTGLGREKPEDKVIRRIRQGYKLQAETEKLTREAADKTTVNGRKLSESYVAPGEQQGRNEDYQELKRYFTNQVKFHQNQKDKNRGNKAAVDSHDAQRAKWVGFGNTLGQYDSKMPHHWKDINDMYTTHLGKVNQALPADASLNEWGTIMRQPSENKWGAVMRQPDEGQSTQTKVTIPPVFGERDKGTSIPSVFDVGSQESSQKPVKIPAVFDV